MDSIRLNQFGALAAKPATNANAKLSTQVSAAAAQEGRRTQIRFYELFEDTTEALFPTVLGMCGSNSAADPASLGMAYSASGKANPANADYQAFL
jgi:hypothetical protein